MHKTALLAGRGLLPFLLFLVGCSDDSDRGNPLGGLPTEVVLNLKDHLNTVPPHVLSTGNTFLATIECVALVPDVVIHEIIVDTNYALQSMRAVGSDGGLAVDNYPLYRTTFRLIGQPNNQILSIPTVQLHSDIVLSADTSELTELINVLAVSGGPANVNNIVGQTQVIERELVVVVREMVISSSINPVPHVINVSYINMTVVLDSQPRVMSAGTLPTRDYRSVGRGGSDVLAEFVIAETSGLAETSVDLIRVNARLLTTGLTRVTLVDEAGSPVATTRQSVLVSDSVDFEFISPLRIDSSRSRRLSIVADVSLFVGSLVVTEVRTMRFRTAKSGLGFSVEGPSDVNGQPVIFTALY
jgi:hypothetical protein